MEGVDHLLASRHRLCVEMALLLATDSSARMSQALSDAALRPRGSDGAALSLHSYTYTTRLVALSAGLRQLLSPAAFAGGLAAPGQARDVLVWLVGSCVHVLVPLQRAMAMPPPPPLSSRGSGGGAADLAQAHAVSSSAAAAAAATEGAAARAALAALMPALAALVREVAEAVPGHAWSGCGADGACAGAASSAPATPAAGSSSADAASGTSTTAFTTALPSGHGPVHDGPQLLVEAVMALASVACPYAYDTECCEWGPCLRGRDSSGGRCSTGGAGRLSSSGTAAASSGQASAEGPDPWVGWPTRGSWPGADACVLALLATALIALKR